MKSFKKALSILLSIVFIMQLGICAFAATDYTIVNPYKDIVVDALNAEKKPEA